MDGWIVWLIVACGFGAAEVLSGSAFYLAPFAIGAACAALFDAALGDLVSVVVFLAASISTLLLIRPLVTSRLFSGPVARTGTQALIGQTGVVLEPVGSSHGDGRVKIGGEVWTARSFDVGREIAAGTEVHVVQIQGATALVIE